MVSIVSKTPSGVNQLLIDAVLREGHELINVPTQYPVEDGSVVSDHVRQVPESITIEFLTTNTPSVVNEDPANNTQVRSDDTNRVQLTFDTISQMAGFQIDKQDDEFTVGTEEVQILTVTTGLKVYTNMIIKTASMPRTAQLDGGIMIVITLQKFKRARSEFFLTPNVSTLNGKAAGVDTQAQTKQPKGTQKAKEKEDSSVAANLFGIKKDTSEVTNVLPQGATP